VSIDYCLFLVLRSPKAPSSKRSQLNTIIIPDHITDEAAIRTKLLNDHNLEIGAGLGALAGKVWRVGLMGHSACQANVDKCLASFKAVMN
jgi:alanine-glyoxylate transaminase/serine-glyoxylate transaminase/serine-pyruvate transaminase